MIERTSSCLHRSGRSISTCSSTLRNTQRSLQSSFWAHGAGDIELPPWWNDFLHQPNRIQSAAREAGRQSRYVLKSGFLDFLYPLKTIEFAQKLNNRRFRYNKPIRKKFATAEKTEGFARYGSYTASAQQKVISEELDLEDESKEVQGSDVQAERVDKHIDDSKVQEVHLPQIKQDANFTVSPKSKIQQSDWYFYLATQTSRSERPSKHPKAGSDAKGPRREVDVHFASLLAKASTDAGQDQASASGITPLLKRDGISGATDQSTVDEVIDQAIADLEEYKSTKESSWEPLIDFWNNQSPELGQAFETYVKSLLATNAIPQSGDEFASTLSYEAPIIEWQMESTFDAGTKFLDLFINHLQSKVLPANRDQWTEKQWAFFIAMILQYPKSRSATRQRTGLNDSNFLTGQRGVFRLLIEASKHGKALTPVRELLGLAIARQQIDFANSLLLFCHKQQISIDEVLSSLDSVSSPLLARWIAGLIERIEIPRWLRLRKDLYSKLQPDRQGYLDLIFLMVEHLLKRRLSLDFNVATYAKIWTVFLKYEFLSNSQFILALDQLTEVDSNDPADLTAFVNLGYKLFNVALQRSDFSWSEPKAQLFLRRMIATHHPRCWEVFQYYRKAFGFNSDVHKMVLQELSDAGEAERWEEVFAELESADKDVDKAAWIHQLLIAYSKRANIEACKTVLESIEKDLGQFPDLASWNAVLHAFVQADNMTGALDFYKQMNKRGVPRDISTYMVLLRGYAARGELSQAYSQLARIKAEGHKLNAKMIYHLVYAYLSNKDTDRAEQLLYETVDLPTPDSKTDAWNALLTSYGHQGKIADINYIHSLMHEYGIKDDDKTYAALMLGFANMDNSALAFKIISDVMPMYNMVPTIYHYNILLDALVRKKEYGFALQIYQALKKQHLKPDVVTQNLAIRAISSIHGHITKGTTGWPRVSDRALAQSEEFLRQNLELNNPEHVVSKSTFIGRDGQPIDQAFASLQFSSILMEEGQNCTEQRMNKILDRYKAFYEEKYPNQKVVVPVRMLTAIAEQYMSTGDLDGVVRLWQQALETISPFAARTNANTNRPSWVLRSRCMLLGPIFRLYMTVLMKREQHVELGRTIEDLTRAGWRFSSSMWNAYVTYLAQRGYTALAFKTCEQHLIKGFPGWPQSMRGGMSPRKELNKPSHGSLRWQQKKPTYDTLVWLAYAYMAWRKKNAFSVQRSERLAELWEDAPRTLNFVTHMPRVDDLQQNLILRHPYYRKNQDE